MLGKDLRRGGQDEGEAKKGEKKAAPIKERKIVQWRPRRKTRSIWKSNLGRSREPEVLSFELLDSCRNPSTGTFSAADLFGLAGGLHCRGKQARRP